GVFTVTPNSLLTAVLASQLSATTRSRTSSLRTTIRRPSAIIPPPPVPNCGESSMEKITRYRPISVLTKTTRNTAMPAARRRGESMRVLLHAHDLVGQAETYQLLTLRLRFPLRGEVAVPDGERHRLTRLDGDTHRVTARAQPLRRLHGAAQGERQTDLDAQRLSLADHERAAESLLAQGGDQGLGVARARDLLDQHGVERGAGLLAEAHGLVAGLVELPLDALRLRWGHERPELDREARARRRIAAGRHRRDWLYRRRRRDHRRLDYHSRAGGAGRDGVGRLGRRARRLRNERDGRPERRRGAGRRSVPWEHRRRLEALAQELLRARSAAEPAQAPACERTQRAHERDDEQRQRDWLGSPEPTTSRGHEPGRLVHQRAVCGGGTRGDTRRPR